MRYAHWLLIFIVVIFIRPATGLAQQWSGILSPNRAIDWSQAGVVGGIPNRTAICATLSPGVTSAQIQSAAQSCPAGQVVFLSAGTYSISGIDLTGVNNVTVRGAGANQTFIVLTGTVSCNMAGAGICVGSSDNNWKGGPSNSADWTAGYSQGTTSITLSSVTNLRVGNPLMLDQLDDDANGGCDAGGIFVSQSTSACIGAIPPGISGPFSVGGNGGGAQRSGRQQNQVVTVVACGASTTGALCTSNNVTISPGLYMPNWRSSQSPQAWWATNPVSGDGIEDLSIDASANTGGGTTAIEFKNASNSWVKGVRSIGPNRAHVQKYYSSHITIADSYFFYTQAAISSYGDECYLDSDSLTVNTIFQAIPGPQRMNGACTGDVVAYNYAINDYYTSSAGWLETGGAIHTAGIAYELFEGNVWSQIESDVFHGTHHFITQFRNYDTLNLPACYASGSTYATSTFGQCNNNQTQRTMAFSRFYNFIGNVMGTAGLHTAYQALSSGSPSTLAIYTIGGGNSANGVTVPTDLNTALTMMRWGNYDTVTGIVQWNPTEIPSALTGVQAPFSIAIPAIQALPASFYLNSKPSWWPAGKPWPAIGPDVTGGSVPNVGGHVYTIPAQDCFTNVMHGPADGTGPVMSFNAAACYSNSQLPAAPTGVKAVAQ